MQPETKMPEAPLVIDGFAYETPATPAADSHSMPSHGTDQPAPRVLTSHEVNQRISAVGGARQNFRNDLGITDAGPAVLQRARASRVRLSEALSGRLERAIDQNFAVRAVAIAVDVIAQKREASRTAREFRGTRRRDNGGLRDRIRDRFGTGIYS